MMQTTHGSCHCGAIQCEVDWDADATEIIECNSSICLKKGFLHLIVSPDLFRLRGEPTLAEYRFNTGVAVHRFCPTCGIHPFYTPRSHPDHVDVNVRCLDGVDLTAVRIVPFNGQSWEDNVGSITHRE